MATALTALALRRAVKATTDVCTYSESFTYKYPTIDEMRTTNLSPSLNERSSIDDTTRRSPGVNGPFTHTLRAAARRKTVAAPRVAARERLLNVFQWWHSHIRCAAPVKSF